ncbi:hypothetical protein FOL47_005287 [Perkinsus chesapeaki]|uniref:Uncharacterized protein n=1 Tax=Perkinsus chesapeaki TaxID=330153 RepID=A0A7J6LXV1_PERCH|nr:hypothetical protein FOL47_005287 [Perkinsus chesapeaki]
MPRQSPVAEKADGFGVVPGAVKKAAGFIARTTLSLRESLKMEAIGECKRRHPLVKMTEKEIFQQPYYTGYLNGFKCERCGVNSLNLVDKTGYMCTECEYVLCGLCYQSSKAEVVERMLNSKRQENRARLALMKSQMSLSLYDDNKSPSAKSRKAAHDR